MVQFIKKINNNRIKIQTGISHHGFSEGPGKYSRLSDRYVFFESIELRSVIAVLIVIYLIGIPIP